MAVRGHPAGGGIAARDPRRARRRIARPAAARRKSGSPSTGARTWPPRCCRPSRRSTSVLPHAAAGHDVRSPPDGPDAFSPTIAYSLTSTSRPLTRAARPRAVPACARCSRPCPACAQDRRAGRGGRGISRRRRSGEAARRTTWPITDVAAALSAANVLTAVGQLEDHYKLYLVVTDTRFKSHRRDRRTTVLQSGATGVVRLSDVATHSPRRRAAVHARRPPTDATPCCSTSIQQPGGNTVEIADGIRDALAAEQKRLPPTTSTSPSWYDQSDLILASAHSVRDAVLIGVALAALVLLLFLRNWRITLVAAHHRADRAGHHRAAAVPAAARASTS